MTVIRPNSITGITSITALNDTISVYKSDGTTAGLQLDGVNFNTTGVSTVGQLNATTLTVNSNNYPSAGPLSNRNILINGGMTVCQRFAINTTNNISNATHTYHVDRFKAYNDNDGVLQGEWVNTEFPEGFRYSLKYTPATADTSMGTSQQSFISYVIEEKDFERFRWGTSDAQQLTLSFKVKTNKAGTYCVAFFNANTFDRYYITEVSITDTTNWNDVTITVPGDTTGTWSMMRINWTLAAASNLQGSADTWGSGNLYGTSNQVNFMDSTSNEFYITGVQLEVGTVATPFEHRSYGDELALCQRYYWQTDGIVYMCGYGNAPQSNAIMNLACPSTMRATPQVTITNTSNGINFGAGANSPQAVYAYAEISGAGAPRGNLQATAEL